MIIAHPFLLEPIKFEYEIPVLVVENPKFFRQLIYEFKNNEKFVLSDDGQIYEISKFLSFNSDVLSLDFTQRKISNAINAALKEIALDEFYGKTIDLIQELREFSNLLINSSEFSLCAKELDIDELIKFLHINAEQSENLVENVLDFMLLQREFLNIKAFVFVGLKSFLDDDELLLLYQDIRLKKLNVLFLEPFLKRKLEFEKVLIIDKDLCEVRG